MRLRIREARDHVEELEDRTWPAVRDEQWKCVLMDRSRMDEMDRLSINRGAEMGELVQTSLLPAPIVRVAPVTNQLAQVVDGNPVLPAGALDLIRETGARQTPVEILENGVLHADREGVYCLTHRSRAGFLAEVVPRRAAPCCSCWMIDLAECRVQAVLAQRGQIRPRGVS